jgi:hypothetical protein
MLGSARTQLPKAIALAGLGFGLAPLLWFLVTVAPPEIRLLTLFASAAGSSVLVWLSLFYFAAHAFPQWPRERRILAAAGLYFLVGVPLAFAVTWLRSLQGVHLTFWTNLESGALALLAWPFMVPLMVVFLPN